MALTVGMLQGIEAALAKMAAVREDEIVEGNSMTTPPPVPREMSGAELDEYIDRLVDEGREDTPEFAAAYAEWESRG